MPETTPSTKYLPVLFEVGSHVEVDSEIKGVVVQISIKATGVNYEVSWGHNGACNRDWFDEWRLADYGDK